MGRRELAVEQDRRFRACACVTPGVQLSLLNRVVHDAKQLKHRGLCTLICNVCTFKV